MTPLYVRMSDAPRLFGLSDDTLRRRAREGCFTIRKRGGASLLYVPEVQAWLDAADQAPEKVGAKVGAGASAKT